VQARADFDYLVGQSIIQRIRETREEQAPDVFQHHWTSLWNLTNQCEARANDLLKFSAKSGSLRIVPIAGTRDIARGQGGETDLTRHDYG
jgi:hypothetical protein